MDADQAFERLREKLGARMPELVEAKALRSGTICWDEQTLPTIYVAPDVARALQGMDIRKIVRRRLEHWVEQGILDPSVVA